MGGVMRCFCRLPGKTFLRRVESDRPDLANGRWISGLTFNAGK